MAVISRILPMRIPLPPNHPKVMWFTTNNGNEYCHFYCRDGLLTDSRGNFIMGVGGKTVAIYKPSPADKEIIKKNMVRQPAAKKAAETVEKSAPSGLYETVDY